MNTDNVIPFPPGGVRPPKGRADPWAFGLDFASKPPKLLRKRDARAAFVVRIDLDGAQPPVWRQLRLASDLPLDQLHEILQVAMGWTDSHLHHFVMGPDSRDVYGLQNFLTRYDIEEGDEGIAEADVRLDQVLAKPGHRLFYEYDFGDGWWHTITLEKVEPWRDGDQDAFCLTGRRACPPEDVGGIGGYGEMLRMLAGDTDDLDSEWVEQVLTWLPPGYDPDTFSVTEVNDQLAAGPLPALTDLHHMVANLLLRVGASGLSELGGLVKRASAEPPSLTEAEVAAVTLSYRLLMAKVGDGITLSKAGYLPPWLVEELWTELDLAEVWIGKGNREDVTWPVLELRETATTLGLLRKARGRLTVTAAGRKVMDDPRALLRHISIRLPLGRNHQQDAGTLALLFMAAGDDWHRCEAEAGSIMEWLGWELRDGTPTSLAVFAWAEPTWQVVLTLGGRLRGPERRTAIARELLRNPDSPN